MTDHFGTPETITYTSPILENLLFPWLSHTLFLPRIERLRTRSLPHEACEGVVTEQIFHTVEAGHDIVVIIELDYSWNGDKCLHLEWYMKSRGFFWKFQNILGLSLSSSHFTKYEIRTVLQGCRSIWSRDHNVSDVHRISQSMSCTMDVAHVCQLQGVEKHECATLGVSNPYMGELMVLHTLKRAIHEPALSCLGGSGRGPGDKYDSLHIFRI